MPDLCGFWGFEPTKLYFQASEVTVAPSLCRLTINLLTQVLPVHVPGGFPKLRDLVVTHLSWLFTSCASLACLTFSFANFGSLPLSHLSPRWVVNLNINPTGSKINRKQAPGHISEGLPRLGKLRGEDLPILTMGSIIVLVGVLA